MANLNRPLKFVQAEVIESADAASISTPIMHFISGMILLQYYNFYFQQADRKRRLSFCLGTIGIVFHLGQMLVDYQVLFQSFQLYIIGAEYTYSLYEALYMFCSAAIILVVQFHFSRLAIATAAASPKFVLLIRILCIGTCIGGVGTSFGYAERFYRTGFDSSSPPVIRGKFLAFYIAWLACNGSTDGAIAFSMLKQLYHGPRSVHQKLFRNKLFGLFNLIIDTFALTFITAMLVLLAVLLPLSMPHLSIEALTFYQNARFVMNGLLPRIYLGSLYYSFGAPRHFATQKLFPDVDAEFTSDSRTLGDDSLSLPQQLEAHKKIGRNLPKNKAPVPIQVTREVAIEVDQNQVDTKRVYNLGFKRYL